IRIENRKYAVITNPMRQILETSKWQDTLLKLIESRKECARTQLTRGNDSNRIEEYKNIVHVVTNWWISMVEILETNDCSEQYTKVLLVERECSMNCSWIIINVRFDGHEMLIIASTVERSAKLHLYWITRQKEILEWQKFRTSNRWHRKYLQFAVSSAALICVNSGQTNIEANILSKATLCNNFASVSRVRKQIGRSFNAI
ncbi:unnamed protein product, partial [Heterotrigona itama]